MNPLPQFFLFLPLIVDLDLPAPFTNTDQCKEGMRLSELLSLRGLRLREVADAFCDFVHTVNALRRDFKADKLEPFFHVLRRDPTERRGSTQDCRERIIELRKLNYSITELEEELSREGESVSFSTISKVLKEEGFARLFRRTV